MSVLTLAQASTIVDVALKKGRDTNCAPLTVAVLDAGGHLVAFKREDKSGILRFDIAFGKAWGRSAWASARAPCSNAPPTRRNSLLRWPPPAAAGSFPIRAACSCVTPAATSSVRPAFPATLRTRTKPAPLPASRPPASRPIRAAPRLEGVIDEAVLILALARNLPCAHRHEPQRHRAGRGHRRQLDEGRATQPCVPRRQSDDGDSRLGRRRGPCPVRVARHHRVSRRGASASAVVAVRPARASARARPGADRRLRLASAAGAAGARISRA